MSRLHATVLLLGLGLLAGCNAGGQDSHYSSVFQHLSIADNGDVIAHAHDGSNARITATGNLTLAGKPVNVEPIVRPLLTAYHTDALALRNDAIATGKAGAGLGMHALGAVAKGLASGNPDSIDKKLQPETNKVNAMGQKVCTDLATLYAQQGKVATAIPAFKPYATIEQHEVSDCHVK